MLVDLVWVLNTSWLLFLASVISLLQIFYMNQVNRRARPPNLFDKNTQTFNETYLHTVLLTVSYHLARFLIGYYSAAEI